jgi:hypothetical protein
MLLLAASAFCGLKPGSEERVQGRIKYAAKEFQYADKGAARLTIDLIVDPPDESIVSRSTSR